MRVGGDRRAASVGAKGYYGDPDALRGVLEHPIGAWAHVIVSYSNHRGACPKRCRGSWTLLSPAPPHF